MTKWISKNAAVLAALLLFTACQSRPPVTETTTTPATAAAAATPPARCASEVRALFDVGSGSTKVQMARVDICTGRVLIALGGDQIRVDYKDALERVADNRLGGGIMDEGVQAIKNLKERAEAAGAKRFMGIATAALRSARNSQELLDRIKRETGITVRIISQEDEASLGFDAAARVTGRPAEQIAVWDIGGGSQQLTVRDEKGKALMYQGQFASVAFKNYVITRIQKKDLHAKTTPNPMKVDEITKAREFAKLFASQRVPPEIRQRLRSSNVTLVGIGGVLARSIKEQVPVGPNGAITLEQINAILPKRAGLNDKKIGGAFASTDVTNLALVAGFMDALGATSYQPAPTTVMDALWSDKNLWP
ncbi:MAG: hypothetical protein KF802_04540 [Bdellovibrionaceae bacterium]|nr:hypothetical protein [Pseudobdellovibrionaceae bacterium]